MLGGERGKLRELLVDQSQGGSEAIAMNVVGEEAADVAYKRINATSALAVIWNERAPVRHGRLVSPVGQPFDERGGRRARRGRGGPRARADSYPYPDLQR